MQAWDQAGGMSIAWNMTKRSAGLPVMQHRDTSWKEGSKVITIIDAIIVVDPGSRNCVMSSKRNLDCWSLVRCRMEKQEQPTPGQIVGKTEYDYPKSKEMIALV